MESRLINILNDKGHTIRHVTKEMSVTDCAKKMCEYGVGALLVMDGEKLEGIVSERDIVRKLVGISTDVQKAKVADIMTRDIISVPPTMRVTEAMRLVTDKRIRHLPVMAENKLLGVVSIGDLTRWAMLGQEQVINTLTKYIQGEP